MGGKRGEKEEAIRIVLGVMQLPIVMCVGPRSGFSALEMMSTFASSIKFDS